MYTLTLHHRMAFHFITSAVNAFFYHTHSPLYKAIITPSLCSSCEKFVMLRNGNMPAYNIGPLAPVSRRRRTYTCTNAVPVTVTYGIHSSMRKLKPIFLPNLSHATPINSMALPAINYTKISTPSTPQRHSPPPPSLSLPYVAVPFATTTRLANDSSTLSTFCAISIRMRKIK